MSSGKKKRIAHLKNDAAIKLLADNVKKYRKEKGFSQEQLANAIGVELSTISRIERGLINTSVSTIYVIAQAFEVDPSDLLRKY